MKINTLSQNNPAFGVRIPINEINISGLKQRQRLIANPQLDKPAGEKVLDTICDKIMNTKRKDSSLISFLQTAVSQTKKIKDLLEQSGKTLERAFWETCDKFFDVQLVANYKDKNVDNITDAKIKEDSYLTKIFHPIKNIEENRKPTIEYCIKNYYKAKAKDKRDAFCEEVKDELNLDMKVSSIRISILGPIIRLPEYYNACKAAIQKEKPTFTEFKEYLEKKAPSDNKNFYNSGNGELLAYTIETFKKYVPEFKEEFVFAEETQANNNSTIADANTIGKKTIKKISKEQSSKDAVAFINYYIDNNIINSKQTLKEIHSALFKTNKNHVSLATVQRWRLTINQIKETLEQYPNKTNEDIMYDIKKGFLPNENLVLYAINKLRALNKTTNDNIVEASDSDSDSDYIDSDYIDSDYIDSDTLQANNSDSDYIDSDTLQANINPRVSIKRTHKPNIAKKTKINDTSNTAIGNRNRTKNSKLASYIDSDSDYIDSDTLQANINTRASIKRTHKPNIAKKTKINDTSNTSIGNRNRTKNSKLASYIDSDSNYSDSDYIDSDTLQANINTQASIKRMHVTKPLDIDKTYSKDDSLKENECDVFNTKDTPDEINMFETKRQHVIPNQDAPILPNLSNKTVIPMPQAMDNDNKNIKEKNGWQSNYDELPPLTSLEYDTFYETSYLSNIPQFINNNDFFTDLENLSPVQPSNTNASTSFDNIDIDKVSSNKKFITK